MTTDCATIRRQEATHEKQQMIREAVDASETSTGYVAFPENDACRVQIVLSDGKMGVDVPNALDSTVTANECAFHVVFVRDFDGDAKIVEFER